MSIWPQFRQLQPPPDGICEDGDNNYSYSSLNGLTYSIDFCIGGNVSSLLAGLKVATPSGIGEPPSPPQCSELTSCLGTCYYEEESYPVIQIGGQCWFAKSLNIGVRISGSSNQTDNSIIEKYCYNDLDSNCEIYGGLYQWDEAMQYVTNEGARGICPAGWHIPSYDDETVTRDYLGLETGGGKMKQTGTTYWASPNTGATNESGFNALPAGMRNIDNSFSEIGNYFLPWSTPNPLDPENFNPTILGYNFESFGRLMLDKGTGLSVRCLKN